MILVLVLVATVSGSSQPNVVQSIEILDKIKHNEQVRYNHVVIKGDLDLSAIASVSSKMKMPVNASIKITDSTIDGNVYFNNSLFWESVNFDRTTFEKCSAFKGSEFKGNSYFRGAKFNGTTSFEEAAFSRNAEFWRSKFNGPAYFLNAKFNKDAFFIGTTFYRSAYFGNSTFNGDAYFDGSAFSEYTNFAKAIFNRAAYFSSSNFDSDAYFWYSEFKGDAFFDSVTFTRGGNFNAVNFFGNASFNNCQFSGDALFAQALFKSDLDLALAKYDKIYIRFANINKISYEDTAYQLLIENFKKLGFIEDANNCYYQYRIERRSYIPIIYRPVDWMLMAFYGYGTKPEFPVAWAFFVILISGSIFFIKNGIRKNKDASKPEKRISIWDALLFSATYFSSGASSIISSEFTEFTPVGVSRYIAIIERLSGWILFGLFLTALANTVIR